MRVAIDFVLILVTVIGGRIVPAFTANALRKRGEELPLVSHAPLEWTVIGLMVLIAITDLFVEWGQFLDHDLDLTLIADPAEPFPIDVPTGDPWFDPTATGTATIPLSRSAGIEVQNVAANMTDEDDVLAVFAAHRAAYGRLDVLVNNAGVGIGAPMEEIQTKHLDMQLGVNLRALIIGTREGLPMLRDAAAEHGKALIVNTASIAGKGGQAWLSIYAATKAAVINFTQSTHREVGGAGIQCTALAPAFVDTPMTEFAKGQVPGEEMIRPEDLGPELRPDADPVRDLDPGPGAPATADGREATGGARDLRLSVAPGPLREALAGPEREIIRRALMIQRGNRNATARMLEINRTTLFNKMRKYGLLDADFGRVEEPPHAP